jgi:GntR family transcriptional regulator
MINKQSPIPLYYQLADLLQQDIETGKYQPGDKIPSETALADAFDIGRPTVRQAIDGLVRQRLLIRRRGAGTFVAETPEQVDLFSLGGTISSFQTSKRNPQVEIVTQPEIVFIRKGGSNPFSEKEAIRLTRKTRVDSTVILIEDIYFDVRSFAGLENMDVSNLSLSHLMKVTFKFDLSGGEQRFSITYPDKRLSGMLNLSQKTPLLLVNRYLHSQHAENQIYSDLFCRTGEFIFSQSLQGVNV